jgi:type II secretory pathway component PulF
MTAPGSSRFSLAHAIFHVGNLCAAFAVIFVAWHIIPRFAEIFHDMLGGQSLPPVTDFVLRFHFLWLLSGFCLALAAIYLAWRYRLQSAPPLLSEGLLLLAGVQIGFIVIALFLPLCGTIVRQGPAMP